MKSFRAAASSGLDAGGAARPRRLAISAPARRPAQGAAALARRRRSTPSRRSSRRPRPRWSTSTCSARVPTFVSPFADDPLFRRFFGERFGMPAERMQNSLGSGVIVTADGIVVTNTHVVKDRRRGRDQDRARRPARVRRQGHPAGREDPTSPCSGSRAATGAFRISSSRTPTMLEVGDLVLAIGNPFGVGQTVTSGIVSALARTEVGRSEAQVFIQTDAAINPGNSGGALVDMAGQGGRHQHGDLLPLRRLARHRLRHTLQPRQADRRQRRDGPQAGAAVARRQARRGDARDGRGAGA